MKQNKGIDANYIRKETKNSAMLPHYFIVSFSSVNSENPPG